MAVASPAIPYGDAPTVRFEFQQTRQKVRLQIRFFSTAAAAPGDEIAKGLGSRDVTVSSHAVIAEPLGTVDGYVNEALESGYVNGTQTGLVGGTWAEFETVDGTTNLTVVAAVSTDPGALSYRVFLTVNNDAKVTVA